MRLANSAFVHRRDKEGLTVSMRGVGKPAQTLHKTRLCACCCASPDGKTRDLNHAEALEQACASAGGICLLDGTR